VLPRIYLTIQSNADRMGRPFTSNITHHMRIFVLTALLLLAPFANAADTARPAGTNCSLASPPAEAGEEMNHGAVFRIYPRAKDIGAGYSGCQVLFAPDAGKWHVISLTEVVKGKPVRVWAETEREEPFLACRYEDGKVIAGNPRICPKADFLLVKSMAPGCVKAMQEAVAQHGLGARGPEQCEHQ